MKYRIVISIIALAIVGLFVTPTGAKADLSSNTIGENVTFTGTDFAGGNGEGYTLLPRGLSSADGAMRTNYASTVIEAPIAFNVVFSRWTAVMPETTIFSLQLRTSADGEQWSDWFDINPNEDFMDGDMSEIVGDMVIVPSNDHLHSYLQYNLSIENGISLVPAVLEQLTFTFIDSTDGPSTAEMMAEQQRRDVQSGTVGDDSYAKPSVISRNIWCTSADCNYTGVSYYPVKQLIVHHTVSGNNGPYYDYAEAMRAIWYYHTYTNGWGDIGYNYLIDTNGVIYEGHLGGDNVVGTHSAAANRGSMAVSLIGNFVSLKPSDPMLNSLINLLAWKADQQGINVFDASDALPDVDWGLPNLMGHRDVYGGTNTQCPGDEAYKLLPWLRQQVANKIGLVDPYFYSQETSNEFSMSNPNLYWLEPGGMCGHNLHAYYTWSVTNASGSTNWGEWRPHIPSDGRYRIDIHTPFCKTGEPETFGAKYEIRTANGSSYRTINQDHNVGLWTSLGEFDLNAGTSTVIRLTDLTTTDTGQGVWFDSIRLLPLGEITTATAVNQTPETDIWLNQSVVAFDWSINFPNAVQEVVWQAATDVAFSNVVAQKSWTTAVTEYSHTFDQDYAQLYWRIVINNMGDQTISSATPFSIDTTPPTTEITRIYRLYDGRYSLQWQGSDNLNQITAYQVDMSVDNVNWQSIWSETTATMGTFQPENPDQTYYFRVLATDSLNNKTSVQTAGQANTTQAISLSHVIMLPIITK